MKCPKCNLQLPDDSEFCQYCGAKIEIVPYEGNVSKHGTGNIDKLQIQSNDSTADRYQSVISVPATIPLNSDREPAINHTSGVAKEAPNAKEAYCKRCGGKIDNTTKKCASCGKRYPRARVLLVVVLSILVLGFAGLSVFQYIGNKANIAKIEQLESTLAEKDGIISSRNSTISTQKTTISNLEKKVDDKDRIISSRNSIISDQMTTISDLEKEIDELKSKNLDYFFDLHFYKFYSGIVPDDGKYLYHIYGCEDLDTSSFWIYNIEAAEQLGYSPCPNCH